MRHRNLKIKTKHILIIIGVIFLTSCANKEVVDACLTGHTYGFWGGLWHGIIAPIDLIGMLFKDNVSVFAENNNGAWYAFGFILGSGGWGFLGAKGARKRRSTKTRIMNKVTQNIDLSSLFLNILGIEKKEADLSYLTELLLAHYARIPFENISKLFYIKLNKHKYLPDLRQYLFGIGNYHFGGTCYSNNYYFYQLLIHLGFDAKLCGAEIRQSNSHMVVVVYLNNSDFLIDVGYGAPIIYPISLDSDEDFTLSFGSNKYVIKPKDENSYSKLELIRDGELIHGYLINPKALSLEDFDEVIKDSFQEDSKFMNCLLISKYISGKHITIHNYELIESDLRATTVTKINDKDELVELIHNVFKISKNITLALISDLEIKQNAW